MTSPIDIPELFSLILEFCPEQNLALVGWKKHSEYLKPVIENNKLRVNIDAIWARYQQFMRLFLKYRISVSKLPPEKLSEEIEELQNQTPYPPYVQIDQAMICHILDRTCHIAAPDVTLEDVDVRDLGFDSWCELCGGEVWFKVGDLYCFKCFEHLFLETVEEMGCKIEPEFRSNGAWINPMYLRQMEEYVLENGEGI